MSGAHSRRKGARFELSVAQRLRDAMPGALVRRGLQYRSGEEVPDVDVPVFWPELKHHRRTNIREAMAQAVRGCPPGRWPVAVCKDDHAPPLVTMQFEDFLSLVQEWWRGRRDV